MKSKPKHAATMDELSAVLAKPAAPMSAWVTALCAMRDVRTLTNDDVLEIAAERGSGSPAQAMDALFTALRVRHAEDRTTLAALAAIQNYHLPTALELAADLGRAA